ncbi:hypothetical protein Hanom_Chr04g00328951 [Helianthus anomalus]
MLNLEQLLFQGIETLTTGDSCIKEDVWRSAKDIDIFKDNSKEDLEQHYLDKFYENIDVEKGHREDKNKFKSM